MVAIKYFFFVIPALCAVIERQTASKITSDLQLIDSDVKSLTTCVNNAKSYGDIVKCQNIQVGLQNDLKNSTTHANNTPSPQSAANCNSFINYVNNVLTPDVKTSNDALLAKKQYFQSQGLNSTVCQNLKQNKQYTDAYGASIVKLCPCCTSAGNAAVAKIDNILQSGINAYCGTS